MKKQHKEIKKDMKKFVQIDRLYISSSFYYQEMNEFKLANKKALKSNSSSQALPSQPQQHHSEQQARIHQDVNFSY